MGNGQAAIGDVHALAVPEILISHCRLEPGHLLHHGHNFLCFKVRGY